MTAVPSGPRVGVHLALNRGLRRAAERAGEIGAQAVQVFVDNPTAWVRRATPPNHLDAFRDRLTELDVCPVAVHASYLVNLGGVDPTFRASSIEVLASDLLAAPGYGARIVNVHTGSHRSTSVEDGIWRVAAGVAEVFGRFDSSEHAGAEAPVLTLENASGGGWSIGTTIEELAAIAEAAASLGVSARRLAFCLDVAHAWGAGVAMDDPDSIDRFLDRFDQLIGLERLAMVHLNDSRSEMGSRQDRHEHVGAGRIGARGLAHMVTHPALQAIPFVLETPGMEDGYDLVNLDRVRALVAGAELEPLPPEAFELVRRARTAAPDDEEPPADESIGRAGPQLPFGDLAGQAAAG